MTPLLRAALVLTLLATAGVALWPDAEPALVAPIQPARQAVSAGHSAVAAAAAAPGPGTASRTHPPATPPVAAEAPMAQLPTRAADWPQPSAAALAAWQGPPAPPAPPPPSAASRQAAAAAAVAAARPPPPVFPYRWIGQLDDGGAPQLLLASSQRSVAVRLGATLDGRWRLQRNASGQLLAQALPDGDTVPVPGAPQAALP